MLSRITFLSFANMCTDVEGFVSCVQACLLHICVTWNPFGYQWLQDIKTWMKQLDNEWSVVFVLLRYLKRKIFIKNSLHVDLTSLDDS